MHPGAKKNWIGGVNYGGGVSCKCSSQAEQEVKFWRKWLYRFGDLEGGI